MNQELRDILPAIEKAANVVALKWAGTIEADEAVQEIIMRLIESPGSLTKLSEMTEKARQGSLIGIGHQVASQYRDDYDAFSGNWYYSTEDVRRYAGSQSP